MGLPGDTELGESDRRAIERALAADPDLEREVRVIVARLRPEARARFWRAFAAADDSRPAAAVLGALEHAAGVGAPPPGAQSS